MSDCDIEETVSDVFISFYRQRQKVDTEIGSLAAYLTVIAKNKSADRLRAHGNKLVKKDIKYSDLNDTITVTVVFDDDGVKTTEKAHIDISFDNEGIVHTVIREAQ